MAASIISAHLLLAWWGLICALLVVSGTLLQVSFGRLRRSHFDVYRALGEPHVLGDMRTTYPARKFVWSERCRALNDELLTRHARLSYYSGMAGAVLGLALVVTVILAAVLRTS